MPVKWTRPKKAEGVVQGTRTKTDDTPKGAAPKGKGRKEAR